MTIQYKIMGRRTASRASAVALSVLASATRVLYRLRQFVAWVKTRHFDFIPRASDIFIVTYPRSGTTLMQMILYQLSTDGNMNFTHITQKIPFFERMAMKVSAVHPETLASPRIFKTHIPRRGGLMGLPKRCRYIYVARDGQDVAASYYDFYRSHGYRGSFDVFFEQFMRGKLHYGSWFKHVVGWWRCREEADVLFLKYEELVADLETSISRIAAFCGFPLEVEKRCVVVERCSLDFMKRHEMQFEAVMEHLLEVGHELRRFIRQGEVGRGDASFSSEQREEFQRALGRCRGPYCPTRVGDSVVS